MLLFNIAKIPKQEGYQHRAAFMVDKFFDKKFFGGLITRDRSETLATWSKSAIKNKVISNQQLAEDLQKQTIRKFEQRKVSFFKDNIWSVDLADMNS